MASANMQEPFIIEPRGKGDVQIKNVEKIVSSAS